MSFDFPLDAVPLIAADRRLVPFGNLLRITGILSCVLARCPFSWSSHHSPYIPILFLDVLHTLLLVRIAETPRGFPELRIFTLFFPHRSMLSDIPLICLGFNGLGCIELLNWVGASISFAPSGYPTAFLLPFLIIPWVISLTSI